MLMSKRSPGAEGVKLTKCFFSSYLFFIFYIFIQISFRRFSIARLREVKLSYIVILGFFFFFFHNIFAFLSMDDISTYVCASSLPKMTVSHTGDFQLPLFQANEIATNGTEMEPRPGYNTHHFSVLVSKITSTILFQYFDVGITLLKHIGFLITLLQHIGFLQLM